MPPRLTVGALGSSSGLAAGLARAGHAVRQVGSPEDIEAVDAVVLDRDDTSWVRESAEALALYARPRQMFIHTALLGGAQLFDAVEVRGAIVMAAHNVVGAHWVTSAADELGETVIGLLIAEVGGTCHPIPDNARPRIAAAQRLTALEATVRRDAFELLRAALPAADAFEDEFASAEPGSPGAAAPEELERMRATIDDPGTARLFADLERRRAERVGDAEAELWAISKTSEGS